MNLEFVIRLENLLKDRFEKRPQGSYTAELFNLGPQKILQKVGEEAVEYILDAQNVFLQGRKKREHSEEDADKQRAIGEGADLVFHFMASLVAQGWSLADIIDELQKRHESRGS